MKEIRKRSLSLGLGLLLTLALLLAAPLAARAASFGFATDWWGGKGVHFKGQGKVEQNEAAFVYGVDGSGDPLAGYYVWLDNWNVLDAISSDAFNIGTEYHPNGASVTMHVSEGVWQKIKKNKYDFVWEDRMTVDLDITSIVMSDENTLTVAGTLNTNTLNLNTDKSQTLTELGLASNIDFWFTMATAWRSGSSIYKAINNDDPSAWANVFGEVKIGEDPGTGPEVPEPGTLLLLSGGLAGLGVLRSRFAGFRRAA